MKRFLALSRSKHGIVDAAMPGFVALLWLGHFPPGRVLVLSLMTAVAGYTAIYALNDLIGVEADRQKFAGAGINQGYSLEASAMRHPLAQNILSMRSGVTWFVFWYALTLLGAYLLNPALLVIVIAAAALEAIYCLLLKVTCWRTLVGGLVKAAGPIAAVFVVTPKPPLSLLLLLLAWLMCWEIGGQNIPADWNDVEEDGRVGAKTIPLTFGPRVTGALVIVSLTLAVVLSLFLPRMSPLALGMPYLVASAMTGIFLLLLPGVRLFRSHDGHAAARLFDRAGHYPLVQLAIVTVFVLVSP
jgi:4-hydroxybenzoate polyprenyltransferase